MAFSFCRDDSRQPKAETATKRPNPLKAFTIRRQDAVSLQIGDRKSLISPPENDQYDHFYGQSLQNDVRFCYAKFMRPRACGFGSISAGNARCMADNEGLPGGFMQLRRGLLLSSHYGWDRLGICPVHGLRTLSPVPMNQVRPR